jgi:hypothetical protein
MDIACAALNGLKMGDRTLTVRRASARWEWHSDKMSSFLKDFSFLSLLWHVKWSIICVRISYFLTSLMSLLLFCKCNSISFSLCYGVGRFFTIISLSDHLRLVVKSRISAFVRHNCIWVAECCHLWFCANLSIASWGSVGSPSLIRLTFSSKPSNKLPCRSLLSQRPAWSTPSFTSGL